MSNLLLIFDSRRTSSWPGRLERFESSTSTLLVMSQELLTSAAGARIIVTE